MLTGISTQSEVLEFFTKWLDREYPTLTDDDVVYNRLILASADDLIADDVDYWSNTSVKTLYQAAHDKLIAE